MNREQRTEIIRKHLKLSARPACGQQSPVPIFLTLCIILSIFIACDPPPDEPDTYTISKGNVTTNGDFTISAATAAAGEIISLTPQLHGGYLFDRWVFNPNTVTAKASGGSYTFTMPPANVTVDAVFVSSGPYSINRGTYSHGEFQIEPAGTVLAGSTVTLTPEPETDYELVNWNPIPNTLRITEAGDGTWTFEMPPRNVTIGARFMRKYGAVSGTKTLTVKGVLGRTKNKSLGNDVYDGTRDITVTVTLLDGRLTDVLIGHPIDARAAVTGSNPFKEVADNLATAIKNSRDPDVAFTRPTYIGDTEKTAAWIVHETAIRAAVTGAIAALREGKPNRAFVRGRSAQNFTADGQNLSGTVTTVGSGHMTGMKPTGGDHQGDTGFLPTDMTVTVTLVNGRITTLTVDSNDQTCGWDGSRVANSLNTLWRNQIINNNDYISVDAVSGASNSYNALWKLIERGVMKLANEY